MVDRTHGRVFPSAMACVRSTWRFGLGAALLLAGCQSPPSREVERTSSVRLPSERALALLAAGDSARTVKLGPPGEPSNHSENRGQGEVIPVVAQAASEKSPPREPEVLPRPEKVAEPGQTTQPVSPQAGALSLTLPEALATSLAQNPDLVTLRGQLGVNQAMVGVAKTPIWNPFVQAQYFPNGTPFVPGKPGEPASGAGQSNFYVWAMQRFELAHQRQFRTQSALAALNQVQWNVFQGELLNVSQTVRLYFTTLYQKELYDLAMANAELNDRLLRVIERRYKANLAKQSDVATAKIAARQSQRQAELAETAYQAALLALHQQLNVPMNAPLALTDRLTDVHWLSVHAGEQPVDGTCLASELVEGRPDVMAARVGIQVAEANWRLARAAMIPDVSAGPIYETADDGTRYLGLRLQMDIPVMNTGAPLARQRREQMNQQALTYEQLKIKAGLEAQAAINQYDRVLALAAKSAPAKADATPPELQEITRLFEAGQADILAVIAMQNNLLQERRIYLDVLNQLSLSAAAVIQATGLPPSRLIAGCANNPPHANGGSGPAPHCGQAQCASPTTP
jgi:outer membrane protein TolC